MVSGRLAGHRCPDLDGRPQLSDLLFELRAFLDQLGHAPSDVLVGGTY